MGCKQSMTGRSVSLEMEAPKPKAAKVTVLSPWGGGPGCAFHYLALPPSPNFFLSFPSLPVLSPLLIVHFYFIAYSSTTMSKDESKSKDETVSVNVDEFTKTRDSVSSFFFFCPLLLLSRLWELPSRASKQYALFAHLLFILL